MMKATRFLSAAAIAAALAFPAAAQSRYVDTPPLVVSPDLSAPWVMQLQRAPLGKRQQRQASQALPGVSVAPAPGLRRSEPRRDTRERDYRAVQRQAQPDRAIRTAAVAAGSARAAKPQIDPRYLPQEVAYDGPHKAGTIVIDTTQNFLFLVGNDGKARRYGVGTGKPGFEWAGTHKVTAKKEWPDWRPPAEMIAREKKKGRILPALMTGGPANPLGARALYLGSTLYRIHGTNQPETIGRAVSSGCIRMRNEDVIDLYERVPVGATVIVI